MLFYVLMAIAVLVAPIIIPTIWFADSRSRHPETGLAIFVGSFLSLLVMLFSGAPVVATWHGHASDISKVVAQEHRIEVQQERIESLTKRLDQFDYPEKPGISLDADTPWASIVESLTDAENELAKAKDERAIAIRSIEARKRGPMSGVVSFVGDYEQ